MDEREDEISPYEECDQAHDEEGSIHGGLGISEMSQTEELSRL